MGDSREREMVNACLDRMHGAIRIPSSGSSTDADLPDVLASIDGALFAIEEKYRTANKRCYVGAEEAEALRRFASRWHAVPVLAVRYSTRLDGVDTADWFVCHVDVPETTDSGSLKLHHSTAKEWPTFEAGL